MLSCMTQPTQREPTPIGIPMTDDLKAAIEALLRLL